MNWLYTDLGLMALFAAQHTLLTTRPAVYLIGKIARPELWNLIFSGLTLVVMGVMYLYWEPSGITIYVLRDPLFGAMIGLHIFFIFMFFYCFKYTSFGQWLGITQLIRILRGKPMPKYYRVNRSGLKRYIRFPHHTFLVLIFWAQPAMTADTLVMAIFATLYTWLGTVHQDGRGRRLLGEQWLDYSRTTNILLPKLSTVLADIRAAWEDADEGQPEAAAQRLETAERS